MNEISYDASREVKGVSGDTCCWTPTGFYPAKELYERVMAGEEVTLFGVSFREETVYIPTDESRYDPNKGARRVLRPCLVERRVFGMTKFVGPIWQLTFGPPEKMSEARMLMAGGVQQIGRFPLTHQEDFNVPMWAIQTSIPNERTGARERQAFVLDQQRTSYTGEKVYSPSAYTGTDAGDSVTIIPFEMYGGEMGMVMTELRPHNRYLYTQARMCEPVGEGELYAFSLQPDTKPAAGIIDRGPRANFIAQTPFADETVERSVYYDPTSDQVNTSDSRELQDRIDGFWDDLEHLQKRKVKSRPVSIKTRKQAMYYENFDNLQERYGINRFLNGGILCYTY